MALITRPSKEGNRMMLCSEKLSMSMPGGAYGVVQAEAEAEAAAAAEAWGE
jgi:hypothetical protein